MTTNDLIAESERLAGLQEAATPNMEICHDFPMFVGTTHAICRGGETGVMLFDCGRDNEFGNDAELFIAARSFPFREVSERLRELDMRIVDLESRICES